MIRLGLCGVSQRIQAMIMHSKRIERVYSQVTATNMAKGATGERDSPEKSTRCAA